MAPGAGASSTAASSRSTCHSVPLKHGNSRCYRKKKKSKDKAKDKETAKDVEAERIRELEALMREEEGAAGSPSGSSRASPAVVGNDRKTAAEKRFEETQRRRVSSGPDSFVARY